MKKKTDNPVPSAGLKKRVTRAVVDVGNIKSERASAKAPVAGNGEKMVRKTQRKPAKASAASMDLLDDLGSLPHTYGEEFIFLVAQDPNWLFTYWDIDISRHPGGPCFLRVEEASGFLEKEIEVSFETRNWYIPVSKAGGSYSVEIGFQRQGKWNPIARSPIITTPRDRFSESTAFDFATLPMHISFQRLVESVSHSFASSEELLPALVKLQQSLPANISSGFPLEARDREILQALLGSEILAGLSSGRWNSEELHSAISQRLRESLSSAEVEAFFSRLPQWNSESAIFSGLQKLSAELESSSLMGSEAFRELLSRFQQLHAQSSLFSGFQKLFTELSGSSSTMGSEAFAGLFSRIQQLRTESSLFSGFQKLTSELAESSALMGSSSFAGLLSRLKQLQMESSLFSGFQRLSVEVSSSATQLSSAAFTELLAVNLSSWLTGFVTSWGAGGASETLPRLFASSSWSGSELSSASEFAARAALSSWLAESGSSWKGGEISMEALAAISSWSSEIMAGQGFAASSWSASQN